MTTYAHGLGRYIPNSPSAKYGPSSTSSHASRGSGGLQRCEVTEGKSGGGANRRTS